MERRRSPGCSLRCRSAGPAFWQQRCRPDRSYERPGRGLDLNPDQPVVHIPTVAPSPQFHSATKPDQLERAFVIVG